MIDFRSDTVTRPTKQMLNAMMSAEVGDDVFGDDPTVNRLEQKAAELFGKEAAIFCPSGTMTNQIAIKVHTQPGDEVICDELSHIYHYEGGGIAFNSGCSVRLLAGDKGRFTPDLIQAAIQADDPHFPVSRLVSVENTCNKGGGVVWSEDQMKSVSDFSRSKGLGVHLDGARLFNALVKTGVTTLAIGEMFDSISICLSKGVGCPVGSLLLGNKDFVHQARRVRKVLGGGMRQAGYLAAAGIYALENHVDRLQEDHAKAEELAEALQGCVWVRGVTPVETNIVVINLNDEYSQEKVLQELKNHGVLAVGFGAGRIRLVTHLDVTNEMIQTAKSVFQQIA